MRRLGGSPRIVFHDPDHHNLKAEFGMNAND